MAPLPEPRVTLRVEGTPIDFLVYTGAQYSALLEPQGKLAGKTSWVQGATGMKLSMDYPKISGLGCRMGIPLFHGHSGMPLPAVRIRPVDQNGGPDSFPPTGN